MEHARLLTNGMELSYVGENLRDARFQQFIDLVNFFHSNKIKIHKECGLDSHNYTYGNIYTDLLYASWNSFSRQESFKGISMNTWQLAYNTLMQHPSLGKEITDDEWNSIQGKFKSNYGIADINEKGTEYVKATNEWQDNRATYYGVTQSYKWQDNDDDWLPNREFSNTILEKEIEHHSLEEDYDSEKKKDCMHALATVFHSRIMSAKGDTIAAYTEEIGSKICEANFYIHDKELSRKESKQCNSMRKIYRTTNRHGKQQYISLDFKHGFMEFHDEHGIHQGEFRFTGQQNSPAEPKTHSLKTI